MALWFRVQRNKLKTPRIAVERKHPFKNKKGTVKYRYETLGGITDRKSPEEIAAIIEKLDDYERFQLENYLDNRAFNKANFHTDMDHVVDEIIYFPPHFKEALFELWKLAKKHNIVFAPIQTAFYAMLNKARSVERSLNNKLDRKVNILEKLGIALDVPIDEALQERTDKESRLLFKALVGLKQPLDKTCEEFISIAKKEYGKTANIKPHYLKKYIDSSQRLSNWYYNVAIDLLLKHGVNPIDIISPIKVAEYWTQVRKANLSIEQVRQLFLKTFKPKKDVISDVLSAIDAEFKRGIPTHLSATVHSDK
jgi:hypothetical protein